MSYLSSLVILNLDFYMVIQAPRHGGEGAIAIFRMHGCESGGSGSERPATVSRLGPGPPRLENLPR